MKEEEAGIENSSTDSVASGSAPDYQFVYRLDEPLGEGNI
jgi:hypothetical protein